MKAVILARISSKEQREGHSLDAQIRNLEQYAQRKSLEIIKKYTLVESSTRSERPKFDQMIEFIRGQRNMVALIVDTVDRLQRSFRETPILNDLMQDGVLELHFVKESNVISKNANSSQKLMWNMGVVMSQSYTDQLSDNVRRSFRFKVKNGEWCGLAPFGYINAKDETGKSTVLKHPEYAPIIKRMFCDYATGVYSIAELARRANEEGLRSRNGNTFRSQKAHEMIQNPFYYGVMKVKGKLYPHKYEPLISKDTFDQCQKVRTEKGFAHAMKETKQDYLFRGLIKCATSGRQVVCDTKKGKYIYLICGDPNNPNKKMWVREQEVILQVEEHMKGMLLSQREVKISLSKLNQTNDRNSKQSLEELNEEISQINSQLDKLTDLVTTSQLPDHIYNRKFSQYNARLSELQNIKSNRQNNHQSLRTALTAFTLLLGNITDIYRIMDKVRLREFLNWMSSNFLLHGLKAQITAVYPLNMGAKMWKISNGCPDDDSFRTQEQEVITLFQKMPEWLKDHLKELQDSNPEWD